MSGRVAETLAELEAAVGSVRAGHAVTEVPVRFPEDHVLGALAMAVNEMLSALAEMAEASAEQRRVLEERLGTIRAQRAAITELSTPVIEVWDGVLTLPLLGTLDEARATIVTRELLYAVTERRARLTILDVTGLEVTDARVCEHLARVARCVRLVGGQCVISGVRPDLALGWVRLGDAEGLVSFPSLRAALTHHVRHTLGTRADMTTEDARGTPFREEPHITGGTT